MKNLNKHNPCDYTKFHLIAAIIILILWDIFFIMKSIPSIPDSTKDLILPYTVILSISSILLYSINIIYNLNVLVKHFQEKNTLQKKELFSHLGFIGEAISLVGINIISTISAVILPFNQQMLIGASILNILSSLFVIEYASILLNTNIKQYKNLKKEEKSSRKYTVWSIINWTAGLAISVANASLTFSNFFTQYKSTDIFKVLLFTSYIIIITSIVCMKSMQENTPQTLLDSHAETITHSSKEEKQPILQYATIQYH